MAMKEINRDNIRVLRPPLNVALQDVARDYGLSVSVGNATFTPTNVRFKIEFTVLGETGQPIDQTVENFKMHAHIYGLSPDDLGKTFYCDGKPFTICGLKTRGWKYPIRAKNANGRVYKFSASYVKSCLDKSKEI